MKFFTRLVGHQVLLASLISISGAAFAQQLTQGSQTFGSASDKTYGASRFEGQFSQVVNPFTNKQAIVLFNGRYVSNVGVIYEGEFEYIPVRLGSSNYLDTSDYGVYIFLGTQIDKEEDSVRHGLFISDPFLSSQNITFRRARPDYITTLRQKYQMQTEGLNAERAAADNSESSFGLFMEILGGMASMKAMNRGALSSSMGGSTRSTLGLLRGAMSGQSGTETALNGVLGQLQGRLQGQVGAGALSTLSGGNSAQEKLIQSAAQGDIKGVLRDMAKQNIKQTFKEYQDSLKSK